MFRKLLLMFAITGAALAQSATTTVYTGVMTDLSQQVVTSGLVTFSLTPSTDSTLPGTGRFIPATINCNINVDGTLSGFVSGTVSGPCVVTRNTAITPGGTAYRICIQAYFSTPGSCWYDYATTATKDISTPVPTLSTGPINYGGVAGPQGPQGPGGIGCGTGNCIVAAPESAQKIVQPAGTSFDVNIQNKVYNAALFCTTPGTLDQTCIQNAAIADTSGAAIFVPAGTYTGTTSTISQSNLHLILDSGAALDYQLTLAGSGLYRSNTVSVSGAISAGTTTFSGNFSAFSAGQTVVIEQVVNNGTVPVDFATVASASSAQLVITTGTRFGYSSPNVSLISNTVRLGGNLTAGQQTITGNFTASFAVGDMIRIENITGNDSPQGLTSYFELVRVASITTSSMTLETAIHSAFGAPWLAKMNTISNVSVEGHHGFIQWLEIDNGRQVNVSGLNSDVLNMRYLYDYQFSNLRGKTTNPGAFFFTFLWNGSVSDVVAYGGTGTTDNGNVKFLGVQGSSISGVSTWQGNDSVQGEYPLMIDFFFTPYDIWNAGDTIASAAVGSTISIGDASIFLGGLRNSSASSLSNTGNITLLNSSGFVINGMTSTGQILIQSGSGYQISNFIADSLAIGQFGPVTNSSFENFTIFGGATENGGSAINVLGGSNIRFLHGEFNQSNLTFFTINAQASSANMYYEDLQDYVGTNLLFSVHTNGTGTATLVNNRFIANLQGTFLSVSLPGGMNGSVGQTTPAAGTFTSLQANSLAAGAITNSTGLQAATGPMCTTAVGTGAMTCTTTVTFPVVEPDTNYRAVCSVNGATLGLPYVGNTAAYTTTSLVAQVISADPTVASGGGGVVACMIAHN